MNGSDELGFRDLLKSLRFLWIAAGLLLMAVLLEPVAHNKNFVKINPGQIERDFHGKLHNLEEKAAEAASLVSAHGWPGVLYENQRFMNRYAQEEDGLAFFLLQNDSLLFWSDNSLVINGKDLLDIESGKIYSFPNSWVYTRIYPFNEYRLIGFVFLKKYFPYSNEFVSNAFLIGKNIPESWKISVPPVPGGLSVNDENGKYVFSIAIGEPLEARSLLHWLVLSFYFLSLLALLLLLRDLLLFGHRLKPTAWWLLALLGDLFLIRFGSWYFKFPGCLYELPLFRPFEHSTGFFASRGDFLFTAILMLFFSYWFYRFFQLLPSRNQGLPDRQNPRLAQSLGLIGWFIVLLGFIFTVWLVNHLMINREDLLEVYRVLTINFNGILDLTMAVAIQAAFLFILYSVVGRLKDWLSWKQSLIGFFLMSAIVLGISRSLGYFLDPANIVFLILVTLLFIYRHYSSRVGLNHGFIVLLLILLSVYEVAMIGRFNREKDKVLRSNLLEQLSNEHDPIAEMLLAQYDAEISRDSVLAGMVMDPRVDQATITSYLKSRYFGLYWNRYEIQPLICDSTSKAMIQPDLISVPCLEHFIRNVKERFGKKLPGSNHFFFLDNFDGLIDYLGLFKFYSSDSINVNHLIVNIDSRLVTQELGYPELLITGKINYDSLSGDYSYAKYHRGFLQSLAGDYRYSFKSDIYPGQIGQKIQFESDGYEHLIYKIDQHNEIVISRSSFRIIDYLITFSYVFAFLYLVWLIVHLVRSFPKNFRFPVMVLKQRIQLTMGSVLVISFLLIGGGMTYYVIQQYQNSNSKLIEEKTGSLLTDIQYKLNMEPILKTDWHDSNYRSLEELLIKFSYVFNTDINLYDPTGKLLASSRPEVYEFNLIGRWMNPVAYNQLHHKGKTTFIHRESIESLGFFSSYMPVYNQNDQLIAYLNLPYFSRQTQIKNEISTIVVAMLNAYFILILLSVFLAVLLANQVTRPLRLIQSKLAGLRLGGRNLGIEYHREDEIGQLVKEYNRMVSELQASADKLARSERESAWREMARQIAHEIKNPLTPMKLSAQHLRRAWKDNAPDLGAHIDKVTKTLIDQIDTLSAIASEFSKFAKMPDADFGQIDLVSKLRSITNLFEDSCRIRFITAPDCPEEVIVFADKEQILQVLNNLIRNAIQAVPDDIEPQVEVNLSSDTEYALIRVTDNGSGIPEELQMRMFEPNFTTKSSGMGLGLAISKQIIEGTGGEIWFETTPGAGTSFFIRLPLFREE